MGLPVLSNRVPHVKLLCAILCPWADGRHEAFHGGEPRIILGASEPMERGERCDCCRDQTSAMRSVV